MPEKDHNTSGILLSVIICTHNPKAKVLTRVLDALKLQSLPREAWELVLVDNCSQELLAAQWDLSWHPNSLHVREDQLGLTPARLRGIRESTGELLVFVDDDNILDKNYLDKMRAIARDWPTLGAIGGSIRGDFEIDPPKWVKPYLEGLAVYEIDRDYWANFNGGSLAIPCGAGLCVRRTVALNYADKVRKSPLRLLLGRSGANMGAGEDNDLVWCAIDLGMGTGRFASLKLAHLIPKSRLTEDYILKLQVGFAQSREILSVLRPDLISSRPPTFTSKLRFRLRVFRASGLQKRILTASERAKRAIRRQIAEEVGMPSIDADKAVGRKSVR